MRAILIILVFIAGACSTNVDLPSAQHTPKRPPQATPVSKLALGQDADLEKQIALIAGDAKGEVGIAAVLLESGDAAFYNADERFPMQSVYKLPIAMAILDRVNRGSLALDEKVGVTAEDMVRQGMRSPLRDQNPRGGEFTIRELIRLSMVESDGTASDVLLRITDGPSGVQLFLTQLGIFEMRVENPEKEIGREWNTQYKNYSTPAAAIDLLHWLHVAAENEDGATPEASEPLFGLLLKFMAESVPGENRLKRLLPKGTVVAHKTGTSGTKNGLTGATNDIGIITLPDGRHVAIAVFVSDSTADEKTREAVIARTAEAVWKKWGVPKS